MSKKPVNRRAFIARTAAISVAQRKSEPAFRTSVTIVMSGFDDRDTVIDGFAHNLDRRALARLCQTSRRQSENRHGMPAAA